MGSFSLDNTLNILIKSSLTVRIVVKDFSWIHSILRWLNDFGSAKHFANVILYCFYMDTQATTHYDPERILGANKSI